MMAVADDRNQAEEGKREKPAEKTEKTSRLYRTAVTLLGLFFGCLHLSHVSTLFENDRYFSHLSEIEREISFRSEMGMYYSYYKTIAESKDFDEGLEKLGYDTRSEYGNVINAIRKYSLLPELLAGCLYHCMKNLDIMTFEPCLQVDRGDGRPPVTSCQGLGVPSYFYLEFVWLTTLFTVAILFYYSVFLSNSVFGGVVTTLFFFYNHSECTRVQWTPPLRESFAYPVLLSQMYTLTMIIRKCTRRGWRAEWRQLPKTLLVDMTVATVVSLCSWQFSHIVFVTQVVALLILKYMNVVSIQLYRMFSLVHCTAILLVIPIVDGTMLRCSFYVCLLTATGISDVLLELFMNRSSNRRLATILDIILTVGIVKVLKTSLWISEDDTHVYNILKSKLFGYKDFHTLLYTCSAEFDFLQYKTYESIVQTLLLPTAILAGVLAVYFWYRRHSTKGYPTCIEADMAYNGLQTSAFIVMAVLVMRLKLFMNPHLCIVAGTVCDRRYFKKIGVTSEITRSAVIVLLLAGMTYQGIERVQEQHEILGEYSNVEQEELFEWITNNTAEHAVFAGKMSLMANIMLSTKRSIVNNPYYESKEMRDRTMKVYEIFSRKNAASVYFTLWSLKVNYVVLDASLCLECTNIRAGCRMIDLWDMVDNGTAKAAGKPPLCPILFKGNSPRFRRVFANDYYVVLQLDYSPFIE